jgi:putative DNA primase/helicase
MKQKHPNDKKLSEITSNIVSIRENPELDKMNPLTYQEIKESTPPPIEYILYPWLPKQGIAFIYAATGVGKTMFTLNVAYSAASGGNFLKFKCPKPRKVLYVDGEMAYPQLHARFMDVIKQQGELDHKDNWYLLTPDKAIFKLPHICSPEGQEYYSKKIEQLGIELLVLDNLSTLSSIDENNSEQWKIIQDWLVSLRKKGISIIIVHHSGKEKRGYRGTSRMLDCVDTAISLQDLSQSDFENEIINGKKFKISYQKNRSFGGQDALEFEVTLTSSGWHYESIEKTNLVRIAEMFNNKMRQVNIAREMGVDESYVSRMVRKAKDLKMIND